MTRTCISCLLHLKLKTSDSKRFDEWKVTHVCKINHIRTASSMEPEGAKKFGRDLSVKINYVTLSFMGMEIANVFCQ